MSRGEKQRTDALRDAPATRVVVADGAMSPGTRLPTLGHAPYPVLRDAYQRNAESLVAGGADALLVETTRDLLRTKASVLGSEEFRLHPEQSTDAAVAHHPEAGYFTAGGRA